MNEWHYAYSGGDLFPGAPPGKYIKISMPLVPTAGRDSDLDVTQLSQPPNRSHEGPLRMRPPSPPRPPARASPPYWRGCLHPPARRACTSPPRSTTCSCWEGSPSSLRRKNTKARVSVPMFFAGMGSIVGSKAVWGWWSPVEPTRPSGSRHVVVRRNRRVGSSIALALHLWGTPGELCGWGDPGAYQVSASGR